MVDAYPPSTVPGVAATLEAQEEFVANCYCLNQSLANCLVDGKHGEGLLAKNEM